MPTGKDGQSTEPEVKNVDSNLGLGLDTNAVTLGLPPPSQVDVKGDNVVENWIYFKLQYENYSIATGLDKKPREVQVATLLSIIGKDCLKIFTRLDIDNDKKSSAQGILEALDAYFQPDKNVVYERFIFGSANQEAYESIDQYVCRLRHLASSCKYENLESELIRDRLVLGVSDVSLRKKLLGDSKLTLTSAIDTCKAHEATNKQLKRIITQNETEDEVLNKTSPVYSQGRTNSSYSKPKTCIYCGNLHQWKKSLCPAFGKTCQNCGKLNHFSIVCKQGKFNRPNFKPNANFNRQQTSSRPKSKYNRKQLHFIGEESQPSSNDDSEDSLFSLFQVSSSIPYRPTVHNQKKKQWFTELQLSCNGKFRTFKCQLDTGSSSNVINVEDYNKLICDHSPHFRPSQIKLKCYDGKVIEPVGQHVLNVVLTTRFTT